LSKTDSYISETVVKTVAGYTVGYLSKKELDTLLSSWEAEAALTGFTQSSENNLLRMLAALYDKVYFLKDCLAYPHYTKAFLRIASYSNYLTDIVVRNPEFLYWALGSDSLEYSLDAQKFKSEAAKGTFLFQSFKGRVNAIKALKRKYLLRIGLRDNLGIASTLETTNDLSIVAKSLSSLLFSICYDEVRNKYNEKELNRKYSIVALGKLGGDELNYSSDIDLLVFYDENALLANGREYHELLTETIQLFIEQASLANDKGFLYRVDFRLRPDGKNSPLARTLSDTLRYYESRGEDWERQMLLKASYLGGDEQLYKQFADYIVNFIFPKNLSFSPLEQIKKLRKNILEKINTEQNIKLSKGGIRDIEFPLQALQLLNGGKFPTLQSGNSLIAISELTKLKFLNKSEAAFLSEAYIFFRKIEHFLQLMNDAQTHTIPESGEILDKLASLFGYKQSKDFLRKLEETKKRVHQFYRSVTQEEKEAADFTSVPFKEVALAKRNHQFLKTGKDIFSQKTFDSQTIAYFEKIETNLFCYLLKAKNPDLILQNFVRIIRSENFPSMWYEMFQNKKIFEAFLTLCEVGKYSVSLFAEDTSLKEMFLSGAVFEKLSAESLTVLPLKAIQFILSVQTVLNIISPEKASQLLSKSIFQKLEKSIAAFAEKEKVSDEFFVCVQGSLAVEQFTFTSDIDLLFVSSDSANSFQLEKSLMKLLSNLQKEFAPVSVDCRLRPEGKSSQIVWSLKGYKQYFENRVRTWELQSLCKLAFVYGDVTLFKNFERMIVTKISTLKKEEIQTDILAMHKQVCGTFKTTNEIINLKKGTGSLLELDFVLQFLILSNPKIFKVLRNKSLTFTLKKLAQGKFISDDDAAAIREASTLIRTVDVFLFLLFEEKKHQVHLASEEFFILPEFLNFTERKMLQSALAEAQRSIHRIFQTYVNAT